MPKRESQPDEVREATVAYDTGSWIPPSASIWDGFREWTQSDRFPESGRIDFLDGDVEVEMSPEDLYTHGTVKTAIVAELFARIARTNLGFVFADSTRVSAPEVRLSVEPDVVVALLSSFDSGRVRQVPAASSAPGRYVELEGAPDLVVEILSDSSVGKDTTLLPPRYAAAGVGELWLVDARGVEPNLEVRVLTEGAYRTARRDAEGWSASRLLGKKVRLTRRATPNLGWQYDLGCR